MTLDKMPVAGMLLGKLRRDFTDALLLYYGIRFCIMRRCYAAQFLAALTWNLCGRIPPLACFQRRKGTLMMTMDGLIEKVLRGRASSRRP